MSKRAQLQTTAIPFLTHQGGGSGCQSDLPCNTWCWAKGLAGGRLARLPQYRGLVEDGRWTGKVWEDEAFPAKIAARKKPAVVGFFFMGDCALASAEFLRRCFEAFADCPQHQFLVLTKRWPLLREKLGLLTVRVSGLSSILASDAWAEEHRGEFTIPVGHVVGGAERQYSNVWVGVSATDQATYDERVSALCEPETGWPGNCWVSLEPLMESVNLAPWLGERRAYACPGKHGHAVIPCPMCNDSGMAHSGGISFVIAGSADTLAHGADRFTPEIARSLQEQCEAAGVPFWLKQAAWASASGNVRMEWGRSIWKAPTLDGRQHLECPLPIGAILRREGKTP